MTAVAGSRGDMLDHFTTTMIEDGLPRRTCHCVIAKIVGFDLRSKLMESVRESNSPIRFHSDFDIFLKWEQGVERASTNLIH